MSESAHRYRGYELLREEPLPDIHAEGVLLRHEKSGARVVLIPCEDDNKVFNIAFRTPPADSTGVAHIIEHTVLCGSREFPLKDPFVELVKGSLNTFLNAMTYPDKTMYPVASKNDADFRNLMHVYLDAVFFPNIYNEKNIFLQEGWHYEMEDEDQPLKLNGVVYNEMKGAFSTPESVLERETMNALFPDTAYGVESGGDPKHIPELTYEAYLDFHRRYYHPSNSFIFLYGDMDMEDTLAFIDGHYLSLFDRISVDSRIRFQEPFGTPIRVERPYPVPDDEPDGDSTYLSYNIVTGNQLDIKEMTACSVLDYALLSAPGAPVRQALLDAGIGRDVYGEFNDGILQPYFSVIAKNAGSGDADRFVRTIREVLEDQAERGIDRKSLIAGINGQEFQFREADYAGYPKGLMYGIAIMDTWLYDENEPFAPLKKLAVYEELRREAESGFFETFLKEKILGTGHAALMILSPKKGLLAEEEEKTRAKLAASKAAMTGDEILGVVESCRNLAAWQSAEDPEEIIATLPMLERSDISRESQPFDNEERMVGTADLSGEAREVKTVFHDAPTNGIGYLELLYDIGDLSEEELSYVSLLKAVLFNIGTENHSHMELNNEINAETGGISATIASYDMPGDPSDYRVFFSIRCKALYDKLDAGTSLIREALSTSRFEDAKRIREIISQTRSALQMGLQQGGNVAAATRALAYVSPVGALTDRITGIDFYRFVRDLEAGFEEKGGIIGGKLESLAAKIFTAGRLLVSYTSEREGREVLPGAVSNCLIPGAGLPGAHRKVAPYGNLREGFRTSGQVQFVAMAGTVDNAVFPPSGVRTVLRHILNYEYLWQRVRVMGGAYGCSALVRRNGDGFITSFRDPNLRNTRDVYLGIPDYIEGFTADEKTMTKYVIGAIGMIDTPLTPSMFGSFSLRVYLQGMTAEELDARRREILGASDSDIRALAPAYRSLIEQDNFCVIGGESRVNEDRELFDSVTALL